MNQPSPLTQVTVSISLQDILYYGFKGDVIGSPMNADVLFAGGEALVKEIITAADLAFGCRELRRKHFFAVTPVALANTVRWKTLQRTTQPEHNARRQQYIVLHQAMLTTLRAGPIGKSMSVDEIRRCIDSTIDSQNLVFAAFAGCDAVQLKSMKEAKQFVELKQDVIVPEDAV